MTVGPSGGDAGNVGDAFAGQPVQQGPTPVARGGYQRPADYLDVDGQQWTADHIRQGALMQRDYTQKTQELAQQRQQIEAQRAQYDAASQLIAALQSDPHGAIAQLAQMSGVDLREVVTGQGQGGQQQIQPEGGLGDGLEPSDIDPNSPIGQRLSSIEGMLEQVLGQTEGLENEQVEQWVDQETAAVQPLFQQLGVPFDPEALYQYAVEREIPDVDAAAKAMLFENLIAEATGQAPQLPQGMEQFTQPGGYGPQQGPLPQPQVPQAFPPEMRQQLASQTPRGGLQTGLAPAAPAPQPGSFAEAVAQSMSELGIRDWSQVDKG